MLNVAIIGAGRMGKIHFDAYKVIDGVKVTCAADVDIEGAKARFNDPGVVFYKTQEELLANEKVDIVDVCSPTYMHSEHILYSLNKGLHTICEKPVALTVDDAKKIADTAQSSGVFFMVAQVIRFWPEYEYLKKVYDEKTFGELNQVVFQRLGEMTKTAWQDWMRDISKSGMAPIDLHIHDVDFIIHMLGKPKAVMSQLSQKGTTVSSILSMYDYGSNLIVSAEGTWYDPVFPFSMSYRASFEKGVLEYRSNKLMLYRNDGSSEQIQLEDVKENSNLNVGSVNGYLYELMYFTDCVKNKVPPSRITPQEPVISLYTVMKELESAKTGKKMILDIQEVSL